jgi:hypothetical protein
MIVSCFANFCQLRAAAGFADPVIVNRRIIPPCRLFSKVVALPVDVITSYPFLCRTGWVRGFTSTTSRSAQVHLNRFRTSLARSGTSLVRFERYVSFSGWKAGDEMGVCLRHGRNASVHCDRFAAAEFSVYG